MKGKKPSTNAASMLSTHAREIAESMHSVIAHLKGEKAEGVRSYVMSIPDKPPIYGPHDVKKIRARTGMSQVAFARLMNVSAKSVEGWEAGTKKPGSSSRRLLQLTSDKAALEVIADAAGYSLVKKRSARDHPPQAMGSDVGAPRTGGSRDKLK